VCVLCVCVKERVRVCAVVCVCVCERERECVYVCEIFDEAVQVVGTIEN